MSLAIQTILVAGTNGYGTGLIANELLKNRYNVRSTVRSKQATSQIRHTFPTYIDSKQPSIAFVYDLSHRDSFVDAIDRIITGAINSASPAWYSVDDVVKDMSVFF
jgi:hypothetical protein